MPNIESIYGYEELSERERQILKRIIQLYILNATPVGSRVLAKFLSTNIKLSPATLRNVMADLEELEYISHPHTSAGRVPTDKGYRFYVDSLKQLEELTDHEISTVHTKLGTTSSAEVLKQATGLLGQLSRYLGIVRLPQVPDLIVEKIELISISTTRVLIVIALNSNIVRTVTLEAEIEIETKYIQNVSAYINEKIVGNPLKYLRDNFQDMINDFEKKDTPLIRLFSDSLDKIFSTNTQEDLIIAGTQNLLTYPEFDQPDKVRGVIELVENREMIIHLLEKNEDREGIRVLIGGELNSGFLNDYSLISTSYTIAGATGTIGLIGPKRMNYPKMMTIVEAVSKQLEKLNDI